MSLNAKKIRKDFPIFQNNPNLTYLDNAATSQKPEKVIERIEKFYREENSNIGRGLYELAEKSTIKYQAARENIANFIGAKKDEIIFVRNTTEAENLLASSLEVKGDIVVSEMSHHSEQLPWRKKARNEKKTVKYLETEEGKISVKSAKDKIDSDTGLVAISHISNVFGAKNPVKQIIEIAHQNNALVVLDAAQSVPHVPVDVKDLNADFLCFSGHKMLGPSGIGVLYGKREILESLEPYQVGGGMISSVTKDSINYSGTPERFEAGTPNIAGVLGLSAAVDYLKRIEMDKVEEHDEKLVKNIIKELEAIKGVSVLSPENSFLVSFTTEFAHPHDVAEILSQNDIAVRAGHHCAQPQMEELNKNGTIRVSPYIYNTEKDIENLIKGVKKVKEVFN